MKEEDDRRATMDGGTGNEMNVAAVKVSINETKNGRK